MLRLRPSPLRSFAVRRFALLPFALRSCAVRMSARLRTSGLLTFARVLTFGFPASANIRTPHAPTPNGLPANIRTPHAPTPNDRPANQLNTYQHTRNICISAAFRSALLGSADVRTPAVCYANIRTARFPGSADLWSANVSTRPNVSTKGSSDSNRGQRLRSLLS